MLRERANGAPIKTDRGFFYAQSSVGTDERTCRLCDETKPTVLFKKTGSGRGRICKACDAQAARERYNADVEKHRAARRAARVADPERFRSRERAHYWQNVEAERHRCRRYSRSERGRLNNCVAVQKYQIRHPDRDAAHKAVRQALLRGVIERPKTCQAKGCRSTGPLHAHHSSYAAHRRLDVDWLCEAHHRATHQQGPQPLKASARRKFSRAPRQLAIAAGDRSVCADSQVPRRPPSGRVAI